MFYIYKHTTPSGRCYIGQTVNPKKRWKPWLSGCKVPEYLREQKLYKGRYLFKEVV